ncbi:hypothetical protein FKM82_028215 [Ascaphus truei]
MHLFSSSFPFLPLLQILATSSDILDLLGGSALTEPSLSCPLDLPLLVSRWQLVLPRHPPDSFLWLLLCSVSHGLLPLGWPHGLEGVGRPSELVWLSCVSLVFLLLSEIPWFAK